MYTHPTVAELAVPSVPCAQWFRYLLRTLRGINSAGIEEALLVLQLTQMLILFKFFDRWMRDGLQVELVSRCLFFALRMYHDQLSAARMQGHGALIESLLHHTRERLSKERDTIGFNIAGIRHLSVRLLVLVPLPAIFPTYLRSSMCPEGVDDE